MFQTKTIATLSAFCFGWLLTPTFFSSESVDIPDTAPHSTVFMNTESNPFHTKRLQTFTVASSQQKSAFKEQKYLETAHWRSCKCWITKEFIPHWKGLVSPQNFALTEVLIPLGVLQYTHNATIKCHNSASVRIILHTNHTLAHSKALSQQTRGIQLVFRHIYHM